MALKKGRNIVKKAKIGIMAYFRIFVVLDYVPSVNKSLTYLLIVFHPTQYGIYFYLMRKLNIF